MRFIHTGDIHLGATPDTGFPWSKERTDAITQTFLRIIDMAEKYRVDLLLIAGDLFHRQPLRRELKELNYYFSKLTHTRVVMIAGNHDYLRENSPYLNHEWPEHVTFLSSATMSSVYFEDINTEVHGFSYHHQEVREPLYDDCRAPSDGRIHILLGHGGDAHHVPIRMPALASSGFDYVALGHIHQPRIFKNTNIAYCGSPEPMDKTDLGRRGCILGEIHEGNCRLSWRALAETEYAVVEIPVTRNTTQAEVNEHILRECEANPMNIFRIRLTGFRDPDLFFDLDAIRALGRIVEITDETEPDYDLDALRKEHAHDLVSYYIQALTEEDTTPIQRKALYYGLRALLNPQRP